MDDDLYFTLLEFAGTEVPELFLDGILMQPASTTEAATQTVRGDERPDEDG
jgi:hypothetical protein